MNKGAAGSAANKEVFIRWSIRLCGIMALISVFMPFIYIDTASVSLLLFFTETIPGSAVLLAELFLFIFSIISMAALLVSDKTDSLGFGATGVVSVMLMRIIPVISFMADFKFGPGWWIMMLSFIAATLITFLK